MKKDFSIQTTLNLTINKDKVFGNVENKKECDIWNLTGLMDVYLN